MNAAAANDRGPFRFRDHDAVVLDLDGVLTRTADLHARAWKSAFDEFLDSRRGQEEGNDEAGRWRPFEIDPEYYRHVDGKPRYDGAADFLAARGIELPRGEPEDEPGHDTVCALGNRKNERFLELLDQGAVQTYDGSLAFVTHARCAGLGTGVVSSSRNCVPVLASAGVLELFDTKIDGKDIAERGLAGKPAPDIFAAAARELGTEPGRCAAVEDAAVGVESARRAGYGCVIGLNRGGPDQGRALAEGGADRVVDDLSELVAEQPAADDLPLPASEMRSLERRLGGAKPALFLDYDGTLTPIVDRPEDAVLRDDMRRTLERLAARHPTAIISGRDLDDLRERVAIEGLVYAGSHGFDIQLPNGDTTSPEAAQAALPALEESGDELERRLADIDGVLVERKHYAVTVHYRLAEEERVAEIERAVDEMADQHPELRKRGGKKIFELLPDVDWDKGEALCLLLDVLDIRDDPTTVPLYIGDDVTDEDAFAVLDETGIAIAVGRDPDSTIARYIVADTDAVHRLLVWLCRREAERS